MEQKNIELIESGLVCDNKLCDYKDTSISVENYKDWINKPCPKCGENLLTEEDYINSQKVILAVDLINSLSEEELAELSKMVNVDELKQNNLFKDAKGLELLNSEEDVTMIVESHKELKVIELIKK